MQENKSRKRIFEEGMSVEDNSIVVSKKPPVNDDTAEDAEKIKNKADMEIKVSDVLDTFAGYLPGKANFMTMEKGTCMICGSKTMSSMRKICMECLTKNGKKIYESAKHAADIGDVSFKVVV